MEKPRLIQALPNLDAPFDMIYVEGGLFDMGDEHGDLWAPCRPVHKVKVSSFYIGKFPVTQAVWKAVMHGENPSRFEGDDLPVERVSWKDITDGFLPNLGRLTGYDYRLSTEAEWEYAARGGKYHEDAYKYAGSDRLKDVGWYTENSGEQTNPVGLKSPNQLGIYDMSGNVYEWCEDRFDEGYYEWCKKQGSLEDPKGPEKGTYRVIRGGDWGGDPQSCRVAFRSLNEPDNRHINVGFRLALSFQSDGSPTPAFL